MRHLHILIRIGLCFLFAFLPLHNVDQWLYDQSFHLRGPQTRNHTDLVLVRIDDESIRHHNQDSGIREHSHGWNGDQHSIWYHQYYEQLLRHIMAQDPKLIVITSYFEWLDDVESHTHQFPKVVFSALLNEENKLIPPPPALTQENNYGYNNIFPDADNVVRVAQLAYASQASLALKTQEELGQKSVRRDLMRPLFVDYRGPHDSFPLFTGDEILDHSIAEDTFTDKIVLIGRSSRQGSSLITPFGGMSHLEVHANILDTHLMGREIIHIPTWGTYGLSLIAVTLSIGIILFFSLKMAWVLLLFFSFVVFLVALALFAYAKLWIGIASPIFCILTTHLVMLGYKLSRQEEIQWKLQRETEYLKEMDQFKNNFISLFSHDLKTPIAKIKAITERTLSENPNMEPNLSQSLHAVQETNKGLQKTITDILRVTKMESAAIQLNKEVIDLNRIVEEATQRIRFFADQKQIKIVLDLEPLFSMEGDAQLLKEVIQNLVENAIKYSPHSGTTVTVQTREIDNKVYVSVKDQGMGIPAEEIPRVTDKFYRGTKNAPSVSGTGLGLYLASYFVKLHKGALTIKSELGIGTEIKFSLPLPA